MSDVDIDAIVSEVVGETDVGNDADDLIFHVPADMPAMPDTSIGSGAFAGSSGDVFPLPPPPLFPDTRARTRMAPSETGSQRSARPAEARAEYTGGAIVFYGANNNFEAICSRHGSRCSITRTSMPSAKGARAAQGRPLGFMAAWLSEIGEIASSKEEHKDAFAFAFLTFEARARHRRTLRGTPGGRELEERERQRRPTEPDSEPEEMP